MATDKQEKLDLTVVIVSYNTEQLTLQAVQSVISTCRNVSYEIITVDNGSNDGTVEKLKRLKSKNKGRLPYITLIENKENLGFAKANNQGIKIAKGDYVLLLNSDTKVKAGAIERLIGFAKTTKDAGAVGAKLINKDGTVQGSVFMLPTISRAILQYWLHQDKVLDKYAPISNKPVVVESMVMAAFLITPRALENVGLLDERYFMFFEDLDYCRRIRKAGLKIYYLPDSEVIHYHGESGKKLAESKDQWRRLIPSSIIYHGFFKHYIFNFILWSGQKFDKYILKK